MQQVGIVGVAVWAFHALQIGLGSVFPAVLEFFCSTSTAFRETRIADVPIVSEHLTASSSDSLSHHGRSSTRDALIALAVVIGTDIEQCMLFVVVPAYQLVFFLDEGEKAVGTVLAFFFFSLFLA